MKEEATARGGFTVNLRSEEGQWLKGVTDENGKVTFQVEKAGHYTADITEKPEGAQDRSFCIPCRQAYSPSESRKPDCS